MAQGYLHWDEKVITDFSEGSVAAMYDRGYVFTRLGKGVMQQTRSMRIRLADFELSSENKRILKKTLGVDLHMHGIPFEGYTYEIGKLAKDFYDSKFGHGTLSAQKMKEMLTDKEKSNFNLLLSFETEDTDSTAPGYAVCYDNISFMHYSFPFYDSAKSPKDMGLGMMIRAIILKKDAKAKYIYLGSLQRPTDTYKLQFKGMEWFDGKTWQTDAELAKEALK